MEKFEAKLSLCRIIFNIGIDRTDRLSCTALRKIVIIHLDSA